MRHANSFRDLMVYQRARAVARGVFEVSRGFPKEETYSLTDQARRSSRSIGAQIAEAWGRRRYEAHFVSKLTDADGEQQETQHWIETALDCAYLSSQTADQFLADLHGIGRMLHSMIDEAPRFCRHPSPRSPRTGPRIRPKAGFARNPEVRGQKSEVSRAPRDLRTDR